MVKKTGQSVIQSFMNNSREIRGLERNPGSLCRYLFYRWQEFFEGTIVLVCLPSVPFIVNVFESTTVYGLPSIDPHHGGYSKRNRVELIQSTKPVYEKTFVNTVVWNRGDTIKNKLTDRKYDLVISKPFPLLSKIYGSKGLLIKNGSCTVSESFINSFLTMKNSYLINHPTID